MSAVETINSAKKPVKINVDEEEVTTTSSSRKRAASPEKKKKPNFEHLRKKRISYTAAFKSEVIDDRERCMTPSELVKKYSNFRLDEPKVCRWMKKKEAILEGAVGEHKRLLKIRSGTKYNELFATLKFVFEDSRKKGHRVS